MDIRITKVSESSYKRQLKLVEHLEAFLSQVDNYKAMRKFHELFYEKPTDGRNNPYFNDLLKTEFTYSCYKHSYSDKFNFHFSKNKNRKDKLEFDINAKSIPEIIVGLSKYRVRLIDWDKSSDDASDPTYRIESLVGKTFSGEYTRQGFNNQIKALEDALRDAGDAVAKLSYADLKSKET